MYQKYTQPTNSQHKSLFVLYLHIILVKYLVLHMNGLHIKEL